MYLYVLYESYIEIFNVETYFKHSDIFDPVYSVSLASTSLLLLLLIINTTYTFINRKDSYLIWTNSITASLIIILISLSSVYTTFIFNFNNDKKFTTDDNILIIKSLFYTIFVLVIIISAMNIIVNSVIFGLKNAKQENRDKDTTTDNPEIDEIKESQDYTNEDETYTNNSDNPIDVSNNVISRNFNVYNIQEDLYDKNKKNDVKDYDYIKNIIKNNGNNKLLNKFIDNCITFTRCVSKINYGDNKILNLFKYSKDDREVELLNVIYNQIVDSMIIVDKSLSGVLNKEKIKRIVKCRRLNNECNNLRNCNNLKNDELMLSELIIVVSPTFFINDTKRNNNNKFQLRGNYSNYGDIVNLIGVNFGNDNNIFTSMIMRNRDNKNYNYFKNLNLPFTIEESIKEQNVLFLYNNSNKGKDNKDRINKTNIMKYISKGMYSGIKYIHFGDIYEDKFFDKNLFCQRMEIILKPYFLYANERGRNLNRPIYCRITGIGLGIWKSRFLSDGLQNIIFIEIIQDIIRKNNLASIYFIDFAYVIDQEIVNLIHLNDKTLIGNNGNMENGIGKIMDFNNNEIGYKYSTNLISSAIDVKPKNGEPYLVTCFAGNPNAYPGNTYWNSTFNGVGGTSEDSAALSSFISELQNPLVNENLLNSISYY